jgi:hypothetical protein
LQARTKRRQPSRRGKQEERFLLDEAKEIEYIF